MAKKKEDIYMVDIYEKFIDDKMKEKASPDKFFDVFKKLSEIYLNLGDKDKHIGIIKKYIDYMRPFYGENSEEYFCAMCLLAFAYYTFKEDKLFEEISERIKVIAHAIGENDDIAAIVSAFSNDGLDDLLELLHYPSPELDDEREKMEKELEDAKRKYGIASPKLLDLLEDIIGDNNAVGDYSYSIELLENLLSELDLLNPDHRLFSMRLYNMISVCYEEMKEYDYAIEYKQIVLDIIEKELGLKHHIYQAAYIECVDLLNYGGRSKEALEMAKKRLVFTNKEFLVQSEYSSELRLAVSSSLFFLNRIDEAVRVAEDNYDINNCYYGEEDELTTTAMIGLAALYQLIDEHEKALKLYKKIKKNIDILAGRNSRDSFKIKRKITEIYIILHDEKKAIKEATSLVKYYDKVAGLDSEESITAHYLLGCAYRENNEFDLALQELNEVYNRQINVYDDPEDEDILLSLYAIAGVYELAGETDKAHDIYSEVLESALRTVGPKSAIAIKAASALEKLS